MDINSISGFDIKKYNIIKFRIACINSIFGYITFNSLNIFHKKEK